MRALTVALLVALVLATTAVPATANELPVLDSGPDSSLPAGDTIEILGSASDPDGDPLIIGWTLSAIVGDVDSCSFTEQNTTTPELSCTTPGQYLVQITAFDGTEFLDDEGSVITFTEPVNTPPIVSSGPNKTGPAGSDLTMMGSAMDPDGDTLEISWILTEISGDQTSCSFVDTNTVSPTVNCTAPGTYLAQIGAGDGVDFSDDTGALVTFTEEIDDLTAPVCETVSYFNGWAKRVVVTDPESGVASISVAQSRRAFAWGAPIHNAVPPASDAIAVFGTDLFAGGRVTFDVVNGDGVAGQCTVRVRSLLAALF